MRPLKLEMTAFCSYADKTVIDMEKLGESGIYLITGDTGAGKTTIFDAITYALYDKPSGKNRATSMLRSKYASPDVLTKVSMTFLHKGRTYLIERSPRQTTAARASEYPSTAVLFEICNNEKKTIATSSTTATKAITDLLGIDHSQFCHISMIAQGDFQRILSADSQERQAIFRKLFDTELYERVQEILKTRESDASKEINTKLTSIRQHIISMECDPQSPLYEQFSDLQGNENTTRETIALVKEIINADCVENKALNGKISDLNEQIDSLNVKLGEARKILTAKANLTAAEKELESKTELSQTLEKAFEDAEKQLPQVKQLNDEIAALKAVIPDYDQREKERNNIQHIEESIAKNKNSAEHYTNELQKSKETSERIFAELSVLANAEDEREKITQEKTQAETRLNNIISFMAAAAEYDKLSSEYQKLVKYYEQTVSYENLCRDEYLQLRKAFFNSQAGILAETLSENTPCPVCGSLSHPAPAVKPDSAPSQEKLEKSEEKLNNAKDSVASASKNAGEINEKCTAKRERAEELLKALDTETDFDTFKTAAPEMSRKTKEIADTAAEKLKKINESIIRRGELSEKLEISRNNTEKITDILHELEKNLAEQEALKKAAEENESRLSEKLIFGTLEEVNKILSEKNNQKDKIEKQYSTIQEQVNSCRRDIASINGRINELRSILKDGENIDTDTDYTALISDLSLQRDSIHKQKEIISARISSNTYATENAEKLLSESEPLIKRHRYLKTLADAARGTLTGKDKITLEAYVQAVYFDRIIHYANLRLKTMSGEQYALKRREDASTKSSKSGLELEIVDYFNGTVRDVGSLSGGESFKASLALALGLSDEIQSRTGGVRLDTLFIDEGFGTLSETSLDQALETLSHLGESNRLVGIISHVAEIKRRIDKQIIVRKITPSDGGELGTTVEIIV